MTRGCRVLFLVPVLFHNERKPWEFNLSNLSLQHSNEDNYGSFTCLIGVMEGPNKAIWICFETLASWNMGYLSEQCGLSSFTFIQIFYPSYSFHILHSYCRVMWTNLLINALLYCTYRWCFIFADLFLFCWIKIFSCKK